MPKVTDAHRAARREQIIESALACFAEKGFQRTSMADIIAASGLSAGAIYLQFESKQQVMFAAGQRIIGRRAEELGQFGAGQVPDPVSVVRALTGRMLADIDPRLLVQLWGEATTDPDLLDLVHQVFAGMRGSLIPYLTTWATQQGVEKPDVWAARALPVVLSLAQGNLMQRALMPEFDNDAYFRSVALVAGAGLLIPER